MEQCFAVKTNHLGLYVPLDGSYRHDIEQNNIKQTYWVMEQNRIL